MERKLTPIRRVVTGNDPQGRSRVLWDGPAPNAKPDRVGARGYTDLWVWYSTPAPLDRELDDGNLPYDFPGSCNGGHLRVIEMKNGRPPDYDPVKDPELVPLHEAKDSPSRRMWDRGGKNRFSSAMHKTETVDYGIVLSGEREMILDDRRLVVKPGDVVVDVGAWHQWSSPRMGCQMLFDMIAARFVDSPVGVAQGNDSPVSAANVNLPEGVKPTRRVVIIDKEPGRSTLVSDGPAPDVRIDPARPGYASTRVWVTDSFPARIVTETLQLPHRLEPPARGTVCRVITLPPDAGWKNKVGYVEVRAFFAAMGSPAASTHSPSAPHPYMQKTRTLDFCLVIDGEVVLVLDTQEVKLNAGEIVVQKGTNHAWSNRSNKPAVIAVASHDAA